MKLLAIETATESCSAALMLNEEIVDLSEIAPRRHNEIILSMCEQVLAQAQTSLTELDAIAFGRGPGAFTGVRLAASVAQGIAMGQDLPVVPVSSLATLAQAVYEEKQVQEVFACIDARMQEVYYGVYKLSSEHMMELEGKERVISPQHINQKVSSNCYGTGSGWNVYAESLLQAVGNDISFDADKFPQAKYVAKLAKTYFQQGQKLSAEEALPVYIRDDVAEKPKNKVVF